MDKHFVSSYELRQLADDLDRLNEIDAINKSLEQELRVCGSNGILLVNVECTQDFLSNPLFGTAKENGFSWKVSWGEVLAVILYTEKPYLNKPET